MINLYDFLTFQPEHFKQFVGKELLLVHYDCPQMVRKVDLYTHYCKIDFVISGSRRIHRKDKSWMSEGGHSYFFKKGAFEQQRFEGNDWRSMCVYQSDRFLLEVTREFRKHQRSKVQPSLTTDHIIELSIGETTEGLGQSLVGFFEQEVPPSIETVEQRAREFVFSYLMNPANAPLLSYLNSLAERPETSLYEVMDANYLFNLSLEDFARIANRSLATFKREFKTVFAVPPAKWLMEKRLNYAQNLMRSSTLPVSDVAYESGFENQTHFCRVLKDKFGTSPLQYRKQSIT